jgi:hydroxyethylthiazole kinase
MTFFDAFPLTLMTERPLVHAITNAVSINDVANGIIACGGSPIMAESPRESAEVSRHCNVLLVNTGMLTDDKCEAILKSIAACNTRNIPVVLDPVGITISTYRRDFVLDLLSHYTITTIKGNGAELKMLVDGASAYQGLDSLESHEATRDIALRCATQFNTTVLCSAKYDCIATPQHTALVLHTAPFLSKFTGSGCLLGGIVATFIAQYHSSFPASVYAAVRLMLAAESVSKTTVGPVSYKTQVIDALHCPISLTDLKERSVIDYD